jgi:TRAP transporter TAXI family solute receptor
MSVGEWHKTLGPSIPMKIHLVRCSFLVACLPWLMFAASCQNVESAGSREPITVKVSTGSPTGNFRPFSEALAKRYAELMPDVRIQSIETPGSVHNIEALQDGTVDIGLAQAGIAYMAYNGRLPEPKRSLRHIRGVAVLNSSEVHLMVSPASTIRSVEELRGRRVGVGPRGGGLALTAGMVLRGYFAPGEVQDVSTSVSQTMSMLLDNTLDAAFTISSVPNDEANILTGAGARLLPLRGPAVDRLRTRYPFFRTRIIPAGEYPGQPQPVHTLSVDVVLLARAGLDDALVRRLTDGLFRMLPKLSAELPFLKGMVPERAPATPVPLHPGAALYYRERELQR